MIKPHIKVIQRNGVDVFVTSSMVDKEVRISSLSNADMLRYFKRLNHETDNDDEKRRTGGAGDRYRIALYTAPTTALMSPAGIDRARLNAQYVGMCGAYGGAFS